MDSSRRSLQSIGFAPDSDRMKGALLVAATVVAAIRLRGEEIKPSPRLSSVIADSVSLARAVLRELVR